MQPIKISAYTTTTALGKGNNATFQQLVDRSTGLKPCDFPYTKLPTFIGRINELEHYTVVDRLIKYDCRNNRLAQLGIEQDGFVNQVEQAKDRYGAKRIGVFMGTSTSGIEQTEHAYRHRDADGNLPTDYYYATTQDIYSLGDFVHQYLHLSGPCFTISTACSSSAKVFASAERMLRAGLIDAAVVGGVDSLCLSTLYGFSSLELLSANICKPCDKQRDGLNIGEGAGFALMEKVKKTDNNQIMLTGYGESSDAYHMSSPHPKGLGAQLAMVSALKKAQLLPTNINYINLHGTATEINDRIEACAIANLFGNNVMCSSTKGWTGHTLGAAGIIEAVINFLCLEHQFIPGTLNTTLVDDDITIDVLLENKQFPATHIVSNSFGFGGNNCSLVFSKTGK